ncbi:MAG: hypothetical protein GXY64_08655 [Bacteroidales bacterium]|nr:hypothetical protein [Bacteroidales bacterium]
MTKYQVYQYLYYALIVLWLVQIVLGGFNVYLLIPTFCLVVCYYLMKKNQKNHQS